MATEDRDRDLERIEKAFDAADAAAGADRAAITQAAQLDAAEAVAMVGIAMEADEEAAEAGRALKADYRRVRFIATSPLRTGGTT